MHLEISVAQKLAEYAHDANAIDKRTSMGDACVSDNGHESASDRNHRPLPAHVRDAETRFDTVARATDEELAAADKALQALVTRQTGTEALSASSKSQVGDGADPTESTPDDVFLTNQ